MKSRKDRGIVRIDQPEKYNHGWWVRRRRLAKMYSKFFADKKHGGKAKALGAARRYNDELTRVLGRADAKQARKNALARKGAKSVRPQKRARR